MTIKKTALVVVDMQVEFEKTAKLALTKVKAAIKHAKRNKWRIINVSYTGCRIRDFESLPSLRNELKRGSVIQVEKEEDGGGDKLFAAVKKHKLSASTFVFCGVNANACVRDTVRGFARLNPKVECIISDAVGDYTGEHDTDRHFIAANTIKLPNVRAEDMTWGT